jgi:hypothetical protein
MNGSSQEHASVNTSSRAFLHNGQALCKQLLDTITATVPLQILPSKIPGTGTGLFVTKDIEAGDEIFRSEPLVKCVEDGKQSAVCDYCYKDRDSKAMSLQTRLHTSLKYPPQSTISRSSPQYPVPVHNIPFQSTITLLINSITPNKKPLPRLANPRLNIHTSSPTVRPRIHNQVIRIRPVICRRIETIDTHISHLQVKVRKKRGISNALYVLDVFLRLA